jgi:hypothetical protein
MRAPPESKRAALPGGPDRKRYQPEDITETTADVQARSFRRLFSLCQATAFTIASLAFAVSR